MTVEDAFNALPIQERFDLLSKYSPTGGVGVVPQEDSPDYQYRSLLYDVATLLAEHYSERTGRWAEPGSIKQNLGEKNSSQKKKSRSKPLKSKRKKS